MILEVEVFGSHTPGDYTPQAKYLVRGISDVYWVDTIEQVLQCVKQELEDLRDERFS